MSKAVETKLYNQKGEEKGTVALNPAIFSVPFSPDLVAQYVRAYQANQRQGTASTKTRGEVRGGGRKPWQQKGTGRARHGSIRSPLWVGGGKAHGPKPRDWSLKMPVTMRRQALFSVLAEKVRHGQVVVVDKLAFPQAKTKVAQAFVDNLPIKGKNVLLVLGAPAPKVLQACRNLPQVSVQRASDLNAYLVAKAGVIVLLQESLKVMEDTFLRMSSVKAQSSHRKS